MPYPAGHREEVRNQIIRSARKLFNRSGFDNVSVDQIMADAGLTRGGFYAYFKSKSDLYADVLGCFLTDPNWQSCWDGVDVDLAAADAGRQIVQAYLSRQHFEDVDNSCPMIALPSDVARGGVGAKRAFQMVFSAMVKILDQGLKNTNGNPRRARAQAIAALCVGGMVIARALDDRALADTLRESCQSVALKLGGWREKGRTKPAKRRAAGS